MHWLRLRRTCRLASPIPSIHFSSPLAAGGVPCGCVRVGVSFEPLLPPVEHLLPLLRHRLLCPTLTALVAAALGSSLPLHLAPDAAGCLRASWLCGCARAVPVSPRSPLCLQCLAECQGLPLPWQRHLLTRNRSSMPSSIFWAFQQTLTDPGRLAQLSSAIAPVGVCVTLPWQRQLDSFHLCSSSSSYFRLVRP